MKYRQVFCDSPSLMMSCMRESIYKHAVIPIYNAISINSIRVSPNDSEDGTIGYNQPNGDDVMVYNSTQNIWEYKTLSEVTSTAIASYAEMYIKDTVLEISSTGTEIKGFSFDISKNITFNEPVGTEGDYLEVSNTGDYKLSASFDGQSSVNNIDITFSILVNGVEKATSSRHYQQAGDDGSSSINRLFNLTQNDKIKLKISGIVGNTGTQFNYTPHYISINLIQLS